MTSDADTSTQEYVDTWRPLVLGRVFTHEQALHFVLEVDEQTGLCRVTRRQENHTEIVQMPLGEVVLRVKGEI